MEGALANEREGEDGALKVRRFPTEYSNRILDIVLCPPRGRASGAAVDNLVLKKVVTIGRDRAERVDGRQYPPVGVIGKAARRVEVG